MKLLCGQSESEECPLSRKWKGCQPSGIRHEDDEGKMQERNKKQERERKRKKGREPESMSA